MSYSTLVYKTHHNSMMGLCSNFVLPKRDRNAVTENFEFLNASFISVKNTKQLFTTQKLLHGCYKQCNTGNAFEKIHVDAIPSE